MIYPTFPTKKSLFSFFYSSDTVQATQPSIRGHIRDPHCWTAEVLHCLNLIEHHHSYHSSATAGNLYKLMFPDSEIAKGFSCAESKAAYLTTFGIAPYLKSLQLDSIKSVDSYVLLFDESLNHHLQSKQLDTHIRYWIGNEVHTRYFTSQFMGHATAHDLLTQLEETWSNFENKKGILQLSMDGPNVNWKLFGNFTDELKKSEQRTFLNCGSCGLHTIHNAFKAGIKASGLDVQEYLTSIYWLFKDSPARRDDFTTLTSSTVFPLSYCGHRWLENVPCLERGIEILPYLKIYVEKVKPKPSCKSFQNLKDLLGDLLMETKLKAVLSIARTMSPFLKKFQGDAPLLPFLAEEILAMVKRLLSNVLNTSALDKIKQPRDCLKIDLKKEDNFKTVRKIDIGTSATSAMRETNTSELERYSIRKAVKTMIVAIVDKMLERSPIMYTLVRNMAFLNPVNMIKRRDEASQMLANCLSVMDEAGQLNSVDSDTAKFEFKVFMSHLLDSNLHPLFRHFNPDTTRLDSFLFAHLKPECPTLWKIVRKLLILSHGQAAVERGFSYNKLISVENLAAHSLIAQRRIMDFIKFHGGTTKVPLSDALIKAAKQGNANYEIFLAKQKEANEKAKKSGEKRKREEELEQLHSKKKCLETEKLELIKNANEMSKEAEIKKDFSLLSASNAIREKAEKKEKDIGDLLKKIKTKQSELFA